MVYVDKVPMGKGAPVTVQSMTNTRTEDVDATSRQIQSLADAGCDIVRFSVYDEACVRAVRTLVDKSPVPLVADVHFDHRLAIGAVENGVAKVRVNPGNIGGEAHVRLLADCVKAHHVPVRIGVNSGSLEKEILHKYGGVTPEGMLESALNHAKMLERCGFSDIVLSLKASNVMDTIEVNRLAAKACDYPLHLGVTEAGAPGMGNIKSAIAIGSLLASGIGDTIRVSLTGDPLPEVEAGLTILRALGIRKDWVNVISCPTCGRVCIDVAGIAEAVRAETAGIAKPLTVAVMGCVVNGPGEAREADVGVAGGKDGGAIFRKGQPPRAVKGDLREALIREIRQMLSE